MKKQLPIRLATLAFVATAMSAHAQTAVAPIKIAPDVVDSPYVTDSQGVIVRNSTGLCWRTGSWTAEKAARTAVQGMTLPAACYCEQGMASQAVCQPAAAVRSPAVVSRGDAAPAPVAPAPVARKVTIPADALFNFDQASLSAAGQNTLDGLLTRMKTLDLEAVVAVGYADRIGNADYNQALSARRAESIKTYLVKTGGIPSSRVFTEGRGETGAVTGKACQDLGAEHASNKKLVACLAPDRRVVIEAVGSHKP